MGMNFFINRRVKKLKKGLEAFENSKVIDYGMPNLRYWGHDFSLCTKLDEEGFKWSVGIFTKCRPQVNDFIIMCMGHGDGDTKAGIVKSVEGCGNPSDMYFVDVLFTGRFALMNTTCGREYLKDKTTYLYRDLKEAGYLSKEYRGIHGISSLEELN